MTYSQKQAEMIKLYNQSVILLDRISKPRYEFSVDTENFIFEKKFLHYTNQLKTGCLIDVEVKEDDIATLILLGYKINWESGSLSMTFGNRYRAQNSTQLFTDLYSNISKSANTVEYQKDIWAYPVKSNKLNEFDEFINSSLNTTKNAIENSTDQTTVMDGSGLHSRQKTGVDSSGKNIYDPCQVILTNNVLAFTSNNFDTVSTAIGKLTLPDGTVKYGTIADVLIGTLILGSKLKISNEIGSVVIDNNVNIYNGSINVWDKAESDSTKQKIFSYNNVKKALDIIGEFTTKVYNSVSSALAYIKSFYITDLGNYVGFKIDDPDDSENTFYMGKNIDDIYYYGNRMVSQKEHLFIESVGKPLSDMSVETWNSNSVIRAYNPDRTKSAEISLQVNYGTIDNSLIGLYSESVVINSNNITAIGDMSVYGKITAPNAFIYRRSIGAEDLNNVKDIGSYPCPSTSSAIGGTNYPTPFAGVLDVTGSNTPNSLVKQTYTRLDTAQTWVRIWYDYGGTWCAWRAL